MTRQLWAAVETHADAWRRSDIVRDYAQVVSDPQHGLGQRLQEILSGYSAFAGQRLRLAHLLQVTPEYAGFAQEPGGVEFLQRGERLAKAFLWTVEWWRSRLPAYPMIPALQLVRNGPLSTQELTLRVPWPEELRRQRLQLTSAPPAVADLLDTAPQPLDDAARAVGAALAKCPQVQELEQAQAGLTDQGRAALASARDRARTALRPEQVDAAAGDLALNRLNYREAVIADIVDSLQGDARRYSDAFRATDRLIEQAAALFSQAVVNGPAPKIGPVLRGERLQGEHGWTEIVVSNEWVGVFAQLDDVVLFDTPALTDAMHVEGITFSIRVERGGTTTLAGRLLPDSDGLRAIPWPA